MKNLFLILGYILLPSFHFDAGAQTAPIDYQHPPSQSTPEAREQWGKLTTGVELALGKKVFFYPDPNYPLTNDANDPYDLTDGTLAVTKYHDDRVWFNTDAVGWNMNKSTDKTVLLMIDLGEMQSVGQIAIRVQGGKEQPKLVLPKDVQFLASADGKQYYSLQKMAKLNLAEKELADGKTSFYVPEEGKAFMYPFVCRQPVEARYVAVRMSNESLYVDQISVLTAATGTPLRGLASFPQEQVFTDGLAVLPRKPTFVVTTNITTPNWLTVIDNTNLDLSKVSAGFRLELPKGLRILPITRPKFKQVPDGSPGMANYEFEYNGGEKGPLWIEKVAGATIPANAKVTFTGIVQGKDSHVLQFPLKLVEIPETAPIKGLDVSLAWMNDDIELQWPNFLRDFKKLGFGYVSTFPRDFHRNSRDAVKAKTALLKQARANGYGIVYNESPFHVMWNTIQKDRKAGEISDADADQIFTQIDGKRGQWMNILYRGKYFQSEIKRIADLTALVQPDHVYMDIEWWTESVNESKKDARVDAAWKKSGKEWDEFVTDMGTAVLRQLVTAIRQAVPNRTLTVGLYSSDPKNLIYNSIFEFKKIYPEIIDLAQPSRYVGGRPLEVAERIRFGYDEMQSRNIIPWLTAGTYGEYDPPILKQIIFETILNGASGFTYYWFGDFDPMDFYYQAQAIKELSQYQQLLQDGKPIAYRGDNPNLHYTAFADKDESLVMVSNYSGTPNTTVHLPLPFDSVTKVLLDGKILPINDNMISLDVPPGASRLIYLSK